MSVLAAGLLNMNRKTMGDRLFQGEFDMIAVMNDFDAVAGLARFLQYARKLSPRSRNIAFGRLSSMMPGYFGALDLDAVVTNGDYETVRTGKDWLPAAGPGRALPATEWSLPDVTEIPHVEYDRLYQSAADKFCGIPRGRELVVQTARGCPIGCDYCDVHQIFGLRVACPPPR